MRVCWSIAAVTLALLAYSVRAAAQPASTAPAAGALLEHETAPGPPGPPSGGFPYRYPDAPSLMVRDEPEVWYGWQSLIGVSASLTTGLVSPLFGEAVMVANWPGGLGGTVFSGPIVHWAHGRTGRGFAVLAMNIGGAGLGLGVGGMPIACAFEKCDGFHLSYGIAGSYVGAMVGAAIDIALLSKYKAPPRPIATRPSVLDSVVPLLDLRAGRATFGFGGVF